MCLNYFDIFVKEKLIFNFQNLIKKMCMCVFFTLRDIKFLIIYIISYIVFHYN